MTTPKTEQDITRTMLSVLFISVLAIGSFWVLQPFLSAFIWAVMIVIPTWPLMLRLTSRLGGRRALATFVMTLAMCLVVLIPFWLAIRTVVIHSDTISGWASTVSNFKLSSPPDWVSEVPVIGARVANKWNELALAERHDIEATVTPYLVSVVKWFPAQLGNAGGIFIHFLLTIVIAAILYMRGDVGAEKVRAFARRLGGERGEAVTLLAGQAIRAVAIGIVVTALVQALVAGIGLAMAGIPFAFLLTALIFLLSLVQIGAGPVLIPTIIWLFWTGSTGWGTFMLLWSVLAMGLDNFLRPFLIKRGADLPMLLIFAGVIGGVLSFGILGLFIGPVILAVTYTLLEAWIGAGIKKKAAMI